MGRRRRPARCGLGVSAGPGPRAARWLLPWALQSATLAVLSGEPADDGGVVLPGVTDEREMVAQDTLAQGVLGVAQHAEGIAAQSVDESGSGAGQAVQGVQVLEEETSAMLGGAGSRTRLLGASRQLVGVEVATSIESAPSSTRPVLVGTQ